MEHNMEKAEGIIVNDRSYIEIAVKTNDTDKIFEAAVKAMDFEVPTRRWY